MKKKWNVGLLLFDEVEVLDFAGPFEVFSVTAGADGGEIVRLTSKRFRRRADK